MKELIVKLRILARAEITLLKADAHRRANQAILAAMSLGCVFVGLLFINMGAFFTLTESTIDARAAWILAAANFALAVVPYLFRRQAKVGPEEAMVREIREMAADEISKDVDAAAAEVGAVVDSVKSLKSGISTFTSSGSGASGAMSLLGPVLPLVIDLLKGSKKK